MGFLERGVRHYQKLMLVKQVHEVLERHPTLPEGSAARIVREDRDGR